MKLGICTRYSRHEATFVALRIAKWAVERGHEVSIYSLTSSMAQLGINWDDEVVRATRSSFTEWFEQENIDALLLTHVPHAEMIEWVQKRGLPIYVVPLWHELDQNDRPALAAVTSVLSPHYSGCDFMRTRWGMRNVVTLPWDTGEPIFQKPVDYKITTPQLYLPLYDGVVHRVEQTALDLAGRALLYHPDVQLTIAYSSSTMSGSGQRRIKQLKRHFGEQLLVLKGVPIAARPCIFQRHDLTLWPTEYESTCMVGLSSATMGTPVLAFRISPVSECLHVKNTIFVQTGTECDNVLGLPRAIPDYQLMDDLLHQVIRDREYLRELQQNSMLGLLERRQEFNMMMQALLPCDRK